MTINDFKAFVNEAGFAEAVNMMIDAVDEEELLFRLVDEYSDMTNECSHIFEMEHFDRHLRDVPPSELVMRLSPDFSIDNDYFMDDYNDYYAGIISFNYSEHLNNLGDIREYIVDNLYGVWYGDKENTTTPVLDDLIEYVPVEVYLNYLE